MVIKSLMANKLVLINIILPFNSINKSVVMNGNFYFQPVFFVGFS